MSFFRGERPGPEETFGAHVKRYARPVMDLCRFAQLAQDRPGFPCRDYLNRLHRESTRLEELLDHYGAQTNDVWFAFREMIAAAKLFTSVAYTVKHLQAALGRYRLLDVEGDCRAKTNAVMETLTGALLSISSAVLDHAQLCGIDGDEIDPDFETCEEDFVAFRLEANRTKRHVGKVGEVVVHLATRFLNLTEDRDVRQVLQEPPDRDYRNYVPEPISEEQLRIVESRFHNLQSLYDTYIFESDLEQQNPDLLFLRGHVSIIYHLLSTATSVSHYYIRHMSTFCRGTIDQSEHPLSEAEILELLFDYPLAYSRRYMESAVQLCRKMIQSYSVQTTIEVPIPNYRGFHVRPSTLVASIVAHYGSDVTMSLNGHGYNAASALELFRANEDINAVKRRQIADLLSRDPRFQLPIPTEHKTKLRELKLLIVELMKENKVIVYDTDLEFEGIESGDESLLAELAVRYVRHFVSVAKMDIRAEISVTFSGDSRALKDIEILAGNGYGEDKMGNNIVLPEELSYLKR